MTSTHQPGGCHPDLNPAASACLHVTRLVNYHLRLNILRKRASHTHTEHKYGMKMEGECSVSTQTPLQNLQKRQMKGFTRDSRRSIAKCTDSRGLPECASRHVMAYPYLKGLTFRRLSEVIWEIMASLRKNPAVARLALSRPKRIKAGADI